MTGLEFSTFLRLVDGNAFKWDLQATFSRVNNEITEIKGNKLVYSVPGGEKVNQEGYPANSFYGFVYLGVYATCRRQLLPISGMTRAFAMEPEMPSIRIFRDRMVFRTDLSMNMTRPSSALLIQIISGD